MKTIFFITLFIFIQSCSGPFDTSKINIDKLGDATEVEILPETNLTNLNEITTPSFNLSDQITNNQNIVHSEDINISIANSSDNLSGWCILVYDSPSNTPSTPEKNDSCFDPARPNILNLGTPGPKDIYLYVKNNDEDVSTTPYKQSIIYQANTPPNGGSDFYAVSLNTAATINVIANDSDDQNDELSISSVTQASNGVVLNNSDGTVSYTPNNNFIGKDDFTYSLTDIRGLTSIVSVSVFVVTPHTWLGEGTTTAWSENENWCGSVVNGTCQKDVIAPGSSDDVYFVGGLCTQCNATNSTVSNINSLVVKESYTGTITLSTNLTISANLDISAGTFLGQTNTIIVAGDFLLSGGIFQSPSQLTLRGNTNITGQGTSTNFLHNSNNVTLNLLASKNISAIDVPFNNLSFESTCDCDLALDSDIIVAGNYTINTTHSASTINGQSINLQGDLILTNAAPYYGDSTTVFVGTGNQQISTASGEYLGNIEVNKTGGNVTALGNFQFGSNYTYTAGTVDFSSVDVTFGGGSSHSTIDGGNTLFANVIFNKTSYANIYITSLTVNGTLTVNNTGSYSDIISGTIDALGDVNILANKGAGSTCANGIIRLSGNTNQSFQMAAGSKLPGLEIASTGGTVSMLSDLAI